LKPAENSTIEGGKEGHAGTAAAAAKLMNRAVGNNMLEIE